MKQEAKNKAFLEFLGDTIPGFKRISAGAKEKISRAFKLRNFVTGHKIY